MPANAQLLARIHFTMNRFDASRDEYKVALRLHSELNDRVGMNKVRHRLAMIASIEWRLDDAEREFSAVVTESRRLNDQKRLSYALHRLAETARLKGQYTRSAELHQQSLEIKQKSGHRRGFVFTLLEQVRLLLDQKECVGAAKKCDEAIALCTQHGFRKEMAMAYFLRGMVERARGQRDGEAAWFRKATHAFAELGLHARVSMLREGRFDELSRRD